MRKGPHLTLVWVPRMVNPALHMSYEEPVAEFMRVYNCARLIWQLWTCVLSKGEVNLIVGYLTTTQLFVFSSLFLFRSTCMVSS